MTQRDLFTEPRETLPYHPHSATSRAAAEAAEPNAGTLRAAVLSFLRSRGIGGATDDEIFACFPFDSQNAIRPRRVELVRQGLVVDGGERRLTRSGREAVVWVAKEFLREGRDF